MSVPECASVAKSWRHDAMRIVEELFPVTPPASWDALLDLRGGLLAGNDWNRVLDGFLACREALEAEHYLPFYRLRRLLTESLRFEAGAAAEHVAPLQRILAGRHRSLEEVRRAVSREWFEHDLSASAALPVQLRVVER